jgi:hypothetical protein
MNKIKDLQEQFDKRFEEIRYEFNQKLDELKQDEKEIEFPDYLQSYGDYKSYVWNNVYSEINKQLYNLLTSQKQYAMLKLQYIADQLNGEWVPDWDDGKEKKWYIYYNNTNFYIDANNNFNQLKIYFKSEELAQKALELMGDDMEYLR